jgi:hypothetical protein
LFGLKQNNNSHEVEVDIRTETRAYLRTHVIYKRHGDRTGQKHPDPNFPADGSQCYTAREDGDEAEQPLAKGTGRAAEMAKFEGRDL